MRSTNKICKTLLLFLGTILLSACSTSIDGTTYQPLQPKFDIVSFFTGEVKAWGIVQNRSGDVVQRFTVTIDGTYNNGELVLDERFSYGLGEGPTTRIWTINQNSDGTYTGNASDIANSAKGYSHGNAFNFVYEMDLPVDDTTYRVTFDDWFWAFDDKQMMNRSYIKKFGIVMAEVTIFMQKQ